MYRKHFRKKKGTSIAELGPALFLVLIVMVLPMACLVSLGFRYTLMFYAVRQAAREAAKSTQFQTNQSALQKSAKNRAQEVVNLFSNTAGANGLKLIACNTYADVINIGTGTVTRYSSPIPAAIPINRSTNVYNITVEVDAEIRPLFPGGGGMFGGYSGGVIGLTRPFPVRMISASMCEQPDGLRN
jgi:peroxiredoxin family protein